MTTNQTKIIVRDFVVPALIGIYPHEQDKTQRIRVSIDVTLSVPRMGGDAIENTMSYEGLVETIRGLHKTHYNLVETIAEYLVAYALRDDRAASVWVRVEKIDVFAEGSVGTEIIRSKE